MGDITKEERVQVIDDMPADSAKNSIKQAKESPSIAFIKAHKSLEDEQSKSKT